MCTLRDLQANNSNQNVIIVRCCSKTLSSEFAARICNVATPLGYVSM